MGKKTPEICKCGARLHPMKKFNTPGARVYWCSGCDLTRVIYEFKTLYGYLHCRKVKGW